MKLRESDVFVQTSMSGSKSGAAAVKALAAMKSSGYSGSSGSVDLFTGMYGFIFAGKADSGVLLGAKSAMPLLAFAKDFKFFVLSMPGWALTDGVVAIDGNSGDAMALVKTSMMDVFVADLSRYGKVLLMLETIAKDSGVQRGFAFPPDVYATIPFASVWNWKLPEPSYRWPQKFLK